MLLEVVNSNGEIVPLTINSDGSVSGGGSGGGGSTNLTVSRTDTSISILSDTGTDVTLTSADSTHAGILTAADKLKLDGLGTASTHASTDFDAAGTASSAITAHNSAVDPHGDRAYAQSLVITYSNSTPGLVKNVLVTAGDASAFITWDKPPNIKPDSYVITGGPTPVTITDPTSLSATITGLTNGQSYTFSVAAKNGTTIGSAVAGNAIIPSSLDNSLNIPGLIQLIDPSSWSGVSDGTASNGIDSSGVGQDWTAPANQPLFKVNQINSLPGLLFNGTNSYLNSNLYTQRSRSGKPSLTSKYSMFLVLMFNAMTNAAVQSLITDRVTGGGGKNDSLWCGIDVNPVSSSNANLRIPKADGNQANCATQLAVSTPYLISIQRPGFAYINGTKQSVTVMTASMQQVYDDYVGFMVGATQTAINSTRGYFFNGTICYFAAFNRVLTQAERWAIEAMIATKFGLTVAQQ